MSSLMDEVAGMLSPDAMSRLGGAIGTTGEDTKSAASAGLPALLGALAGASESDEGASRVFDAVSGADTGMLSALPDFFGAGDDTAGASMLTQVLGGGAISSLVGALASRTGMGAGVFSKLLPMLAPAVMGVIGKRAASDGLDAGGVQRLLAGERSDLDSRGFGSLLGLSGLGALGGGAAAAGATLAGAGASSSSGSAAASATSAGSVSATGATGGTTVTSGSTPVDDDEDSGGGLGWLLPLLLGLALVALLAWALNNCSNDDEDGDAETPAAVTDEASADGDSQTDADGDANAVATTETETTTAETEAPTTTPVPTTTAVASDDVVSQIAGDGDLSSLAGAVTTAGLADTLQSEGPFTIFAPNNDAFDALDSVPDDPAALGDILQGHVVAGELTAEDVASVESIETINGNQLPVTVDGDEVRVGGALVMDADRSGSNGVVHVIDAVILPGGGDASTDDGSDGASTDDGSGDASTDGAVPDDLRGLDPITFEVASDAITAEGRAVLDGVVETLTAAPRALEVRGHTDSDGDEAANQALSQARAESVIAYLVDGGVNGDDLTPRGFGEGSPIASNDTSEGKAENRRIEFVEVS